MALLLTFSLLWPHLTCGPTLVLVTVAICNPLLLIAGWFQFRTINRTTVPTPPKPLPEGWCWTSYLPAWFNAKSAPLAYGNPAGYLRMSQFLNLPIFSQREASSEAQHSVNYVKLLFGKAGICHASPKLSRRHRWTYARLARRCVSDPSGFGDILVGADGLELFYDTPLHAVALGPHLRQYLSTLTTAVTQSPVRINRTLYPLLQHFGMLRPPPTALDHRHGFHVALERRSLDMVSKILTRLPNNAAGFGNFMTMFMRDDKVQALGWNPAARYNPALTGKDLARYNLAVGSNRIAASCPPVWFAHDTLHYLNPSIVGRWFDLHPELQTLICTAVIPVETVRRSQSVYPGLYQLFYDGDMVCYTPEGDSQASYYQPVNAHRWLSASTLITPQRECIHVAIPMSTAAHHVVIFSRPQIANDEIRFFDQSQLITIPWLAHPLGTVSDRLTDPALYQALFNYVYRNEKTGLWDINTKATAYKNEVDGKYPQSYIDAATTGVLYQKNFMLRSAPDKVHYTWFWVSTLLGLPLVPFVWLLHSYQTKTLALPFQHVVPYLRCAPLPAAWGDDAELMRANGLCPAQSNFWWIPARGLKSTLWTRIAVFHALLGYWLLAKVIIFPLVLLSVKVWPIFAHGVGYTIYNLDFTAERLAWGLTLVFLVSYFRLFPMGFAAGLNSLLDSLPFRKPVHILSTAVAILYGLPSSPYRSNNGHFVFSQAFIGLQTWAFIAPRPLPFWLTPYPAFGHRDPRSAFAGALLLLVLLEQAWLFYDNRNGPACVRPWHVPQVVPPPTVLTVPTGPPPVQVTVLTPPVAPAGPLPAPQPVGAAPLVVPPQPPPPAGPPPPYTPNAFAAYSAQPANTPNFTVWRNTMARLPPPVIPSFIAGRACVWDLIGQATGLLPLTCMAAFLSSIPAAAAQQPYLQGTVLGTDLPQVLAYFGLTFDVYACVDNGNGPTIPAGSPPIISNVGLPSYPALTACIVRSGQGLHISYGPPQADASLTMAQIPLNMGLSLSSVRLGLPDVAQTLQIPSSAIYSEFYDRLLGLSANMAAISSGLAAATRGIQQFVNPVYVPLTPKVVQHSLTKQDLVDAQLLASDFKAYPEVLKARDTNVNRLTQALSACVKNPNTAPAELVLLHGAAGTGKSFFIRSQLLLWARDGPIRFHTMDPTLRPQLMADFEPEMKRLGLYVDDRTFCTGFVPFFQPTNGTLVLDDAGLLCAGYVQLLMACGFSTKRYVFTYDSTQTRPPFPEAKAMSRQQISTVEWLNAFDPTYATGNRRMSWEVCDLFGQLRILSPGSQIHHGAVVVVGQAPPKVPLLVASPRFAETIAKGQNTFCTTFADCQGLSVDGDIALDLGGMTSSSGDALIYTALTRCTGTVYLVLPELPASSANFVSSKYGSSQIASALLAVACRSQTAVLTTAADPDRLVARAFQAHMSRCLPAASRAALNLPAPDQFITGRALDHYNMPMDPTIASSTRLPAFVHRTPALANNRKVAGRPETTVVSGTRAVQSSRQTIRELGRHRFLVTEDTVLPTASTPVEIPEARPVRRADAIIGEHPIRWQPSREKYVVGKGWTQQATLNGSPLGLTHSARDRATESLSLRERIKPAVAAIRPVHRRNAKRLHEGLSKFIDTSAKPLNYGLLRTCVDHSLESWLSGRTQKDIVRAIERAPVDWSPKVYKLFLKSQRVKKLPKAHAAASKGQIVTDVSHLKLFHDSVWALYVEKSVLQAKRKNVYLHARMSISDTKRWYSKFWDTSAPVTYCDYTGWDSGVDESFTLLYSRYMRSVGVPDEVVKRFISERHESRTFLGPFPAMQASGDRYTWLNNTIGNMAITGASFDVDDSTIAAFSGDDMIMCGASEFRPSSVNRRFIPKVTTADTGEFCGLMFGGNQLHVDSKTLLHRATIAVEDNRRDYDYWESVAYTLRFADSGSFYDDESYAAVATLLESVYLEFQLPPSRFPPIVLH